MSTLGADVLRLWIAATDYANEMALSDEILKRMSESYRRMRNTVRFLLGNLAGFDPATDAVPPAEMVAIDRWALQRTAALHEEIAEAVSQVRVPPDLPEDAQLLRRGLSAGFYLDLLKDRLCTPRRRRASRAARRRPRCSTSPRAWCAGWRPILSYTADEIWSFLPGKRGESVFLETWHALPKVPEEAGRLEPVHPAQGRGRAGAREAARRRHDRRLARCRSRGLRKDEFLEKLKALGEELRFLLITSNAMVKRVSNAAGPPVGAIKVAEIAKEGGVWVRVQASTAPKCERCWHHRPEVGSNPEHPTICGRCVDNVTGPGESRQWV